MKTALLSIDSPKYLRRLVRELNSRSDGFYSGGQRYTLAALRAGVLKGRRLGRYLDPRDPRNNLEIWVEIDPANLSDAYVRTICASRTV